MPSALVATRKGPGNSTLSYLEGHEAINQANRIFGYGNWGVEPVGDPMISRHGDKTMYAVRVKVSVTGSLSYTGTGTGVAERDTAEEHEKAIKTAETDAMKRALRHFGDGFGNRLYDTDAPAQRPAQQQAPRQQQATKPATAPQQAAAPSPAPTTPAPAQKQQTGADRGDLRLNQFLLRQGITSEDHPGFKILDGWLREAVKLGIKDFRHNPNLAIRNDIMDAIGRTDVVEWLHEELAKVAVKS